jgi:hypothetical protein
MKNIISFRFGAFLILIDQNNFPPNPSHYQRICCCRADKSASNDPDFHAISSLSLQVFSAFVEYSVLTVKAVRYEVNLWPSKKIILKDDGITPLMVDVQIRFKFYTHYKPL